MEIQKTALYNYHKNLGAKFVPFAGYEMPIQYKEGIVKEHISTRTHAGFFDVSHMGQFFLEGDETLINSLEKIIPADLKSLKINHSKWHRDKGNKYKRSAELISAGLCHLIISCNEKETIEYIEESIKWLKEINVDQPCPSKNHLFKAN